MKKSAKQEIKALLTRDEKSERLMMINHISNTKYRKAVEATVESLERLEDDLENGALTFEKTKAAIKNTLEIIHQCIK